MQNTAENRDLSVVDWAVSHNLVEYQTSVFLMEQRALQIARRTAGELVWLLEHPPIYTAGTRASEGDLLTPSRFPVYATGRGGELTYHGPGQRVVYVMLDVRQRFGSDVKAFVDALEGWGIAALAWLGVAGHIRPGRVGIWVEREDKSSGGEAKIAALGIRIRSGVSFHGMSINVAPDLEHFTGIVPCGIREFGVTSLCDLGSTATMKDVDNALRETFERQFGPTRVSSDPILGLPHASDGHRSSPSS